MILKVKKIEKDAKLPAYAKDGDAGMDIFALEKTVAVRGKITKIRTGISIELQDGFVGLCWDKSGLSMNNGIKVLAGVIDSGFRGELVLGVVNLGLDDYVFEKGHKVMQMIVQPYIYCNIIEVDSLSDSKRGQTGFGSSGK